MLLLDPQEGSLQGLERRDEILAACTGLLETARALGLPVRVTTLLTSGDDGAPLAPALQPLIAALPEASRPAPRRHVSAMDEPALVRTLAQLDRSQLVLLGGAAHGSVLLTALGAIQRGYDVHVIADAVGSPTRRQRKLAFASLRQAGVWVTALETARLALLSTTDRLAGPGDQEGHP